MVLDLPAFALPGCSLKGEAELFSHFFLNGKGHYSYVLGHSNGTSQDEPSDPVT